MMLIKLANVLAIEAPAEKAYDFVTDDGKAMKGVSISASVTGILGNGKIAIVRVKAKSVAEVNEKLKSFGVVLGKPCDIPLYLALRNGVANLVAA